MALALSLLGVGTLFWLLAVVGFLRDRRSAGWNRIVVGVLLVALPPVAAIYWFSH